MLKITKCIVLPGLMVFAGCAGWEPPSASWPGSSPPVAETDNLSGIVVSFEVRNVTSQRVSGVGSMSVSDALLTMQEGCSRQQLALDEVAESLRSSGIRILGISKSQGQDNLHLIFNHYCVMRPSSITFLFFSSFTLYMMPSYCADDCETRVTVVKGNRYIGKSWVETRVNNIPWMPLAFGGSSKKQTYKEVRKKQIHALLGNIPGMLQRSGL